MMHLIPLCAPLIEVIDLVNEDIKKHWSQYSLMRDTTCHWCSRAIDHYPLNAIIHLIHLYPLYPLNNPSTKSVSLQFREKDTVGTSVRGLITSIALPLCNAAVIINHRGPLGWSGEIFPWWSRAGCLENHLPELRVP